MGSDRQTDENSSPESGSRFFYVTYIRTTREKLWQALTQPEFTRRYWCDTTHDTDWKEGSTWKLMIPDGRVGDSGVIKTIEPPNKLVLTWRNDFIPALKDEGYTQCTFLLETMDEMVKLTVIHEADKEGSRLIEAVAGGWPLILNSLKSLLETGESLKATQNWPEGM